MLIGLTRTETVFLSHCSKDNVQVNRAMFTYVPPVSTLENSTFCARRVYIFVMFLITNSDYLCIINLSVFITEEECVLLRGHGSDSQSPTSHRGSSSRSICGGDKAVIGQVLLRLIQFPLTVSSQQCYALTIIYMLLFPEGYMGEAWEPSKNSVLLEVWEYWVERCR